MLDDVEQIDHIERRGQAAGSRDLPGLMRCMLSRRHHHERHLEVVGRMPAADTGAVTPQSTEYPGQGGTPTRGIGVDARVLSVKDDGERVDEHGKPVEEGTGEQSRGDRPGGAGCTMTPWPSGCRAVKEEY